MLKNWFKEKQLSTASSAPPTVLHLSGPVLDQAMASLESAVVEFGGFDAVFDALAARANFIQIQLSDGAAELLSEQAFYELTVFMPSVRRRIGAAVKETGFEHLRQGIVELIHNPGEMRTVDERLETFINWYPADRQHRWTRDLAAEILHAVAPGVYPLMTRWVWDSSSNTGVLREIWHSEDGTVARLDIPDGHAIHLNLRDELVGYLINRGIGSDPEFMVDVLMAQIYASYIASQGAAYLKADFSGPNEEFLFALRMLGLDGTSGKDSKTRTKLPESGRHRFQGYVELNAEDGALCQSMKNP